MKKLKPYRSYFHELKLSDLQGKMSPVTRKFRKRRSAVKGREVTLTKVVDFNFPDTFFFLTEPTESFNTQVVNPDTLSLDLEPDNSYTMEIQIVDFEKKIDNDYLSVGVHKLRELLNDSDLRVWCDCPSFHPQGFNYKLSQKDASTHPTNILPTVWDKIHPNSISTCKHLGGLLNTLSFFVPAMVNKLRDKVRRTS